MKNYIIPYAVSNHDGWTSAVDAYHSGNDFNAMLTAKIQRHTTGVVSQTICRAIEPRKHFILEGKEIDKNLNEPYGRCTILISCSDDVMIFACMYKDGVWGVLPVIEVSDPKKSLASPG
jgi:hypothetical protein